MAVVRGTNCGFVIARPVADPEGLTSDASSCSLAFKDTSPADATRVTEIGWWCDNVTNDKNFEVAIYAHNTDDDNPEAIVGAKSDTNAKGTDVGWKYATGLDIAISPNTIYWVALQLDATSSSTWTNKTNDATAKTDKNIGDAGLTLLDPWGVSSGTYERRCAIYAVYETEAPPVTGQYLARQKYW